MAKAKKGGEKVRLQAVVSKETVDRIDELAARMNMTRSYFVATMLDEAVQDEEWMVKLATSRLMAPVRAMIQKLTGGRAAAAKAEYERQLKEFEKELGE